MGKGGGKGGGRVPMTPARASAIQSTTAKANGGQVPKGSFAARAQSAAAQNTQSGGSSSSSKT